jgi:molybdopterin-dependent oxidoreductase alpha subunit
MTLRKPARLWRPSLWASLRPFGFGLERPNNFAELWKAFKENRGQRAYALRILRHGVCDGCALGTTGMRDWTQSGLHLCNIRLRLLRLNTQPSFSLTLLSDLSDGTLPAGSIPTLSAPGARRTGRATPPTQLHGLGRIPAPMLRRRGDPGFRPITWEQAIETISARLGRTAPERMAFYLTARGLPNETYYLAQKAVRALGSPNIDNAARICHAPSSVALKEALGVAASTCSYKDWIGTDLVVFFGSNVANNQPVATKYLYLARKAGTRVAVVNPWLEPGLERYWIPSVAESALFGTKLATDHFGLGLGGDVAFIAGALKTILAEKRVDEDFVTTRTAGFPAFARAVSALDWPTLEAASGTSQAEMERFGRLVGEANRAVFVWSMGVTQHVTGEDAVRQIINLALVRGFLGRDGCGLMPIRGHSGVQGGAEMGAYATAFPGGVPITPESARALGAVWNFTVPNTPGITAPEALDAAARGELDVLYAIGGNFLDVLPDPDAAARALARVPFRVHHDIVLSRQMLVEPADTVILLPAMTRYEIPGGVTSTSTERRVIFSPEIPGPRVLEARHEGGVLHSVAARARPQLGWSSMPPSMSEVRAEIARVVPMYRGIESLAKRGDQFQIGGPHLCPEGRCETADGRANFGVVPLPASSPGGGRLRLTTRRGKQFNSMIHEQRDALTGGGRETVFMARADAEERGLADGVRVLLSNDFGKLEGVVRVIESHRGSLQVHWPEGNVLLDPRRRSKRSGIPDYNADVEITRIA